MHSIRNHCRRVTEDTCEQFEQREDDISQYTDYCEMSDDVPFIAAFHENIQRMMVYRLFAKTVKNPVSLGFPHDSAAIFAFTFFCVSNATQRIVTAPIECPRTSPQKIPSMFMKDANVMNDTISARFLHIAQNTE